MDFVADKLASGHLLKMITVMVDRGKEGVHMARDPSIPALNVTRVLEKPESS